jgi:hypothetical protein
MADQAGEGRVPDCLGIDFKEKFMSPQGADIYKVGDIVPVSWYGGKSGQRDRPILVTLLLNSKDDATVNMTIRR